MGDDLLELAKAKELASVMGGAWHAEEWDVDSDSEQTRCKAQPSPRPGDTGGSSGSNGKTVEAGGFLSRTLYRRKGSPSSNGSVHSSINGSSGSGKANGSAIGRGSIGERRSSGAVRRPADGRAPGRRDPAAVARLEAEAAARRNAEKEGLGGVDPSWQLPTNVDYYTAPAALLRELVKEMPADKRLSFQTRVANARSKEAIESLLEDFAARLESLVLPHARSRQLDLQQVKKDTARERVVLNGKEMAFWGSASDKPHTWHEELWATLEARVTEGLLGAAGSPAGANSSDSAAAPSNGHKAAEARVDNARALACEEWNKARAVATTTEIFKAMSRTGAGGDAYFALVALFCTADKLVVPVHCQESPITVEFLNRSSNAGGKAHRHSTARSGKKGSAGVGGKDDVHVLVTVPSTFDIYLRDGAAASEGANGRSRGSIGNSSAHKRGSANGGGGGGGGKIRKGSSINNHSDGDGAAATDASSALHLVRVKAVVEEEIWVVGSTKVPAATSSNRGSGGGSRLSSSPPEDNTPPTLRFLLDPKRDGRRTSVGSVMTNGPRAYRGSPSSSRGRPEGEAAGAPAGDRSGGRAGEEGELSLSPPPPTPAPAPFLALTRTERRMCVTVVPEPSAVSEMVRSFSRRMGVDVAGPQPPRVLGR